MKRLFTLLTLVGGLIFPASVYAQSSGPTPPPPPVCSQSNAGALYTNTGTNPSTVYTCSYYNLVWQWVVNPSYGGLVYYPTLPSTCNSSLPVFLSGWPNTAMYVCVGGVPDSIGGYGDGVTLFSAPSGSWPGWLVPTVTNPTTTPSLGVVASTIPTSAGGTGANTASGALANLGGLALTGGTLTGALNGTSASFSGTVATAASITANTPFIDPRAAAYGASCAGDLAIDDSSAISAALAQAQVTGGTVLIPGICYVQNPIIWPHTALTNDIGFGMTGAGPGATIRAASTFPNLGPSSALIYRQADSSNIGNTVTLSNLSLDANSTASACLTFEQERRIEVDSITCHDATGKGYGSGATASGTFVGTGFTGLSMTAGGASYTGPVVVAFLGGTCSVLPTAKATVLSGAVNTITLETGGVCSVEPSIAIFDAGGEINFGAASGKEFSAFVNNVEIDNYGIVAALGAANRPNFGIFNYGNVNDSKFTNVTVNMNKLAGVYVRGMEEAWINFHPWGNGTTDTPYNTWPQHGAWVMGFHNTFSFTECDTIQYGCFLSDSGYGQLKATDTQVVCPSGNACENAIMDAGLGAVYLDVEGGAWDGDGPPSGSPINWLATPDTTTTNFVTDWPTRQIAAVSIPALTSASATITTLGATTANVTNVDATHVTTSTLGVYNLVDGQNAYANIRAGLTTNQKESVFFSGYDSTLLASINVLSSNYLLEQLDTDTTVVPRLQFDPNSNTEVNAGAGANSVRVNAISNSGTGGLSIYSGGATPSKVASIDGSGVISGVGTSITGTASGLSIGGTAAGLSGTPALPDGVTATEQSTGSADAKVATDSYVDRAVSTAIAPTPAQCLAATIVSVPCGVFNGTFTALGASGTTGTQTLYTSNAPASAQFQFCVVAWVQTAGSAGTVQLQASWTTPGGSVRTNTNLAQGSLASTGGAMTQCTPTIATEAGTSASFQVLAVGETGSPVWETEVAVLRVH